MADKDTLDEPMIGYTDQELESALSKEELRAFCATLRLAQSYEHLRQAKARKPRRKDT